MWGFAGASLAPPADKGKFTLATVAVPSLGKGILPSGGLRLPQTSRQKSGLVAVWRLISRQRTTAAQRGRGRFEDVMTGAVGQHPPSIKRLRQGIVHGLENRRRTWGAVGFTGFSQRGIGQLLRKIQQSQD
jgi:hypothetical protein